MCGIAGILRVHEPGEDGAAPPSHVDSIPESWLDILDASIQHRGPDGAARFRDRIARDDGSVIDVALVHRRLAIIDPEGGHQPMVHDGERLRPDLTYQPGETPIVASDADAHAPLVAVAFNGCIYNHHALRETLDATFETDHADTEVFPHAWRAWGPTFGARLDGMFAFAVWDRRLADIAVGRDPSGEKPLYTLSDNATRVRVFGSAAPGVARLGRQTTGAAPAIQRGGVIGALYHGWTEGAAIQQIEADREPKWLRTGGLLNESDASEEDDAAWWPWAIDERRQTPLTADDAERLLRESVHRRLEADVPLAVFLSGGIDSGLVAAFAREQRADLTTLTVRMPDPRYDESEAAADTARRLGANHRTLECRAQPADDLVKLVHQLGVPFGDSSLLPTYWLCEATRDVAGVALSGDGGDELFGGYQRHAAAEVLRRWRTPLSMLPMRALPQRDPTSGATKAARLIQAARRAGFHDLRAIFPSSELDKLLGTPNARARATSAPLDPLLDDFRHYLPHDLMRKTDTASMAVALEVRAPFLSRELVRRCLSAPLAQLMPRGERKGLLKQVARRHLPPEIVDRPKMGFAIPVGEWFRTDFGGMRTLLLDHLHAAEPFPGLGEAGVEIDMGYVRRLLREHDDAGSDSRWPWKGRDHSQRLYMLLVLSIWSRWLGRLGP